MCLDGHVQLAGGKDTREGRVEICSNGVWGTIYHSNWDVHDATVACKQLGLYQPYSSIYACLIILIFLHSINKLLNFQELRHFVTVTLEQGQDPFYMLP